MLALCIVYAGFCVRMCSVPPPEMCVKQGYDYGKLYQILPVCSCRFADIFNGCAGRGAGLEDCEYAEVIELVAHTEYYEIPSWYAEDGLSVTVDPTLDSMWDCQVLCQGNDDCEFWSYQWEYEVHQCYLKKAMTNPTCPKYSIWPFADPGWEGASGPKECGNVYVIVT